MDDSKKKNKMICPRCTGNGYVRIPNQAVGNPKEIISQCTMCNSEAIKKMLTKPIHFTKKKNESTGKLTKKYIEDNKEILKDLKKESQKNYDGT